MGDIAKGGEKKDLPPPHPAKEAARGGALGEWSCGVGGVRVAQRRSSAAAPCSTPQEGGEKEEKWMKTELEQNERVPDRPAPHLPSALPLPAPPSSFPFFAFRRLDSLMKLFCSKSL